VLAQPRHGAVAEALLECRPRCADDSLDATGRLQPLGAAPYQQRLPQILVTQLDRADLGRKPADELVLVDASEHAKTERGADLHPMPLDRTPVPVVVGELTRIDLHLLGHVIDCRSGHLGRITWKPGFELEELQQQAEAQARHTGLVTDQLPVLTDQRPRRDQILRRPLTLHGPAA
jgi:hypothetical protein